MSQLKATTRRPETSYPDVSASDGSAPTVMLLRTGLPSANGAEMRSNAGGSCPVSAALDLTNCHTPLLLESLRMRKASEGLPETKPRMPVEFIVAADEAIARHRKRKWTPEIRDTGEAWECPYADEDQDRWWALLFQIFGTRQSAVIDVFFAQIQQLLGKSWSAEKGWITDEKEMRNLFSIISSLKPRNEAEAAYAAQLCCLHISAMKLGQVVGSTWGADARTVAVLNKTVRAYGEGLLNFQKFRGGGSRQRITVRKHSQHEHKHIHLHQGGGENGNQPHGPRDTRSAEIKTALETSGGAALPCPNPSEHVVHVPGHEREEAMPRARRRPRVRRAERRA